MISTAIVQNLRAMHGGLLICGLASLFSLYRRNFMDKPFKTYRQQLTILRGRNLVIKDGSKAIQN